jgi:hypothetical protein
MAMLTGICLGRFYEMYTIPAVAYCGLQGQKAFLGGNGDEDGGGTWFGGFIDGMRHGQF